VSEARRERKVITVLFADLVGFTSAAEQLDPEDVEAILRPYHERLRFELERWGGTVEKFIGDAVVAFFGAPVAGENDPERAVRAALAIRDWIAEEGKLQVRIGVNTGEALVRLDANPESGEGMAAGDVVNTAARLQSAAPTNGILVGEPTYRATAHTIDYREHESVEAKGKEEPVPVWEVAEARARFGVDLAPEAGTPLVGREREVESLVGTLARAPAARAGARHADRRSRHRQEPARRRALPVDRTRRRADVLASGALAAVRPGRQLLGSGRDGEGAGRHPRDG
jgi:class 3 adenylate cyclase